MIQRQNSAQKMKLNREPWMEKSASGQSKEREKNGAASLAYPFDTTEALQTMMGRYSKNGRAQNVSFRKLVGWLKVGERATHYLHSYPAKLLPQIAHFFLATHVLSRPKEKVLDPFGGTGTVALEALLSGRDALYADVNPLAQLIANVKTNPIAPAELAKGFARLTQNYRALKRKKVQPPSGSSVESVCKLMSKRNDQ
jgi:hypothetical protein